jgi:deoxyribodipyrimidine photo-lyase
MKDPVNIFWFRRDLRLEDNAGLYHALQRDLPVVPVFIFDRSILDELDDRRDQRVEFIYKALAELQKSLSALGSTLDVRHGYPKETWDRLCIDYSIDTVFANHDYEPYALARDRSVAEMLEEKAIEFISFKDQVIFEKDEVLKDDGSPYVVFTPYSKRWKTLLNASSLRAYATKKYFRHFVKAPPRELPTLASIGFQAADLAFPSASWKKECICRYASQRDFPALEGTSRLSVHLRFGTISIRTLASETKEWSESFLNELIWREFYQMILWQYPRVVNESFRREYDRIKWRNNPEEFEKWCRGLTGYPIVDAGMRQLNKTGYMHNRVRMIVASFLTKHLLIDWRWGEAYFAKKLLDYELASNNGGWQWAAGSGCDAAPYFRVFNPYLQTKKFDPDLNYIRKWVPEFEQLTYPSPMVNHDFARKRCLDVYAMALKK